jgi:hypothetical protein
LKVEKETIFYFYFCQKKKKVINVKEEKKTRTKTKTNPSWFTLVLTTTLYLSLSISEQIMGMNNQTVLKVGLVVVGLCIAGYILGPPLYWHFMEGLAAVSHSSSSSYACPPCQCDCSSQPLLSLPEGTQKKKRSHLYLLRHLFFAS